jgi:TorA maturation chaperone TorD
MDTNEHLAARAAVFTYLSLGFSPPGTVALPEVFVRLREATGFLPPRYQELLAPLVETAVQDQPGEGEYWRLFGSGGTVSPYETEYDPLVGVRKGHELADLLGFYTAFGFKIGEAQREFPDHLAVELEFMSLLLLKVLYARQKGMAEAEELTRDAAAAFLRDHLGRWVEAFAERLQGETESASFRALARLLQTFLGEEGRLLGVTPMTIGASLDRPGETVQCPFAGQCGALGPEG